MFNYMNITLFEIQGTYINLLKLREYSLRTTRFNIQKFYMYIVITLGMRVLYGSLNKQRLLPYTTLADWFCITEVECLLRSTR